MTRKMALVRVGADSGAGGVQSPLFDDGTFELLRIPEAVDYAASTTYGNSTDKLGRPLVRYLGERFSQRCIHHDPDFVSMTYGDPTTPKRGLAKLCPGDYLVFTCGLQRWSEESGWIKQDQPHIYLAGMFVVEVCGFAAQMDDRIVQDIFSANAHVRDSRRFISERDRLVLVKGGPGSRLFTKAVQISELKRDASGKPLKVLSRQMKTYFGELSGRGSLQRSTPRWVANDYVEKAVKFLTAID